MQKSKFNLEVQTCSYFSQLKININIKQERTRQNFTKTTNKTIRKDTFIVFGKHDKN
jgi:hypothetical protein